MNIKPIFTEKSLKEAKLGRYTFLVPVNLTKEEIKKVINSLFSVHVKKVSTVNYKGGTSKNFRGEIKKISARKKAIVSLSEKEKIDLFEEEKGKK
jgi:large subunit ribosomal protein L23